MLLSHLRKHVLSVTTAAVVLLTTSISVGQPLNLPTTEEWIGGFVQGGLQAADALGSLRGRSLRSSVRRPLVTGRSRLDSGAVRYASPSYSGAAYPSDSSSLPANPLPPANRPPALLSTNAASVWPQGIHIVNPAANQVPIRFVVDGKSATLGPGQRLEFDAGAARTIEFDRGGQFGRGIYGLGSAVFTFTPTQHGWELFQTPHPDPASGRSTGAIQLPPPIPWPAG